MFSFTNMVMLFLGIEILSIPLYVLAGSRRDDLVGNEAALKDSPTGRIPEMGILLFGMTLVYGVTGSFDLAVVNEIHRNRQRFSGHVADRYCAHHCWFEVQNFCCSIPFLGAECEPGQPRLSDYFYSDGG